MAPDGPAGATVGGRSARSANGPATSGGHRLANVAALTGLAFALLAVLALGTVFFFDSIVVSLQGPDPCGATKGAFGPDTACAQAHPDYYAYDPATGYVTPRSLLISQAVDPVAFDATLPLALAAALISWLALALGTSRRRMAIAALTIGGLVAVAIGFLFLAFVGGGGD